MAKTTFDAAWRRSIIRAACIAHPDCRDQLTRSYGGRNVSQLINSELSTLALALNIGIAGTIDKARYETEAREAAEPVSMDEADRTDDEAQPDAPDEVQGLVDEALAPLGALKSFMAPNIIAELTDKVRGLAVLANKPAQTITVDRIVTVGPNGTAEAPDSEAPAVQDYPARTGAEVFNRLFGFRLRGAPASLKIEKWHCADAPPIDRNYVLPPEALFDLATTFNRDNAHVWLFGPHGTGKTSLAMQYAAYTGRPFVRIGFNRAIEPVELVGGWYPSKTGGVQWKDGALVAAMRRPGTVILLDEPTVARPGTLTVLQTVLDFGFITLTEKAGERVKVADGVRFVACDNTNGTGDTSGLYADTMMMNRAFLDRFRKFIRVDYMDKTREAQALSARTGCPTELATALAEFAHVSRARAINGDLTTGVGFRRLLALAEALIDGTGAARALETTIINGCAPEDSATLQELIRATIEPAKLQKLAKGETPKPPRAEHADATFCRRLGLSTITMNLLLTYLMI